MPCLVDGNGVQPTRIGALPPQLAALIQTNINVQALTVEAALTGKREHIYHAAMLDPHTAAELDLDQIWALVDDLIEAHGDWLPTSGLMAARTVAIVPHTHWDREWYQPFQTFRLRLVDLLDEFLPRLERDPSYARFLLDGQMAVVDDYLEVRPEAEPVLRRLAGERPAGDGPVVHPHGRVPRLGRDDRPRPAARPRAGRRVRRRHARRLPARHVRPHRADAAAPAARPGFEHAVVWRGVPAAVDRTGFWWTAPDGSTVRAEYLWVGYGNGAAIPDDAKALVARIRAHVDELGDALPDGAPLLWMNGTDHQVPQPWLGRVVAEANEIQDDYHLVVTSLAEYLPTAPVDGLPAWTGELRSGARANLLMGVASNRVDVKQAAARAERALERRAEPLSALFLPPEQLAGPAARPRLARGHPQRRPRLDLRVLGRRGGRRGAPPLRRGRRRSPWVSPAGPSRARPVDGRARHGRRQPVGTHPQWPRRARAARRRRRRRRRPAGAGPGRARDRDGRRWRGAPSTPSSATS